MITRTNEWKTSTKHISCECKCKLDGTKCYSNQFWSNNKCWCECKKHHICAKVYVWNPSTCICDNGKYLASIMDNSAIAITCDEIIDADSKLSAKDDDETKTIPTNSNEKKTTCKMQNVYILIAFLWITISLLIAVSI